MSDQPYSYRANPAVPPFDDRRPLFVFDEVCVLCSGGASFIMRHDPDGKIALTSAQGALGQALYQHYGLQMHATFLFLANGIASTKSEGYFAIARVLGGWWRLGEAARIVPRGLRDWLYDLVARNRYRWFGKTEACALLTDEQRARML